MREPGYLSVDRMVHWNVETGRAIASRIGKEHAAPHGRRGWPCRCPWGRRSATHGAGARRRRGLREGGLGRAVSDERRGLAGRGTPARSPISPRPPPQPWGPLPGQHREPFRDRRGDGGLDGIGLGGGVNHRTAARLAGGDVEEGGAQAGMEAQRLGLEAILSLPPRGRAGEACLRRKVEDQGQVGPGAPTTTRSRAFSTAGSSPPAAP